MERNYFLGLDIGTDSVGYAVTDTSANYNLIKYKGEPMWGVTLFDAAQTKADRRAFRTARRRLDRRQQRVKLVQEIFAKEIAKVDPGFFRRINESALLRTDASEPHCLFNDPDFTDRDYHKRYPTIHHLIVELMQSKEKHDARLVYIACAWLVAHRGHFLSDISLDNVDKITEFSSVYDPLMKYFEDNFGAPWHCENAGDLARIIKEKAGVNDKVKAMTELLLPDKTSYNEAFPYDEKSIFRLIAGGTAKLKDLYKNDEYAELDPSSVTLGCDNEKFEEILSNLGDDGDLLVMLKAVYDWSILCDLLSGENYISVSKVKKYEQHGKDLKLLKRIVRKYVPEKYGVVFRRVEKDNYVAYSGNTKSVKGDVSKLKKTNSAEDFCKFVKKIVEKITPDAKDRAEFDDMMTRLDLKTFMPKQVTGDNRVIPYQLYYKEMQIILDNAKEYLPFLSEADGDGYVAKDKLLSIMDFRIPYYVGPLNKHSEHAWIERKADGKIYPWNFEEKIDLDKSEYEFIAKMTNQCTYLPGEDVLPKHSLLYEKYEVLNEINKIKINGIAISVEAKQSIYTELFEKRKKVTVKMIKDHLAINGLCSKEEANTISGIDVTIKSSLSSRFVFDRLLSSGALSENDIEKIIVRMTYSESKGRLRKWLDSEYPELSEEDRKYISSQKINDFGVLSGTLLCGIEGADTESGEADTIIGFMWNRNVNLMELLSDRYTFAAAIEDFACDYYTEHPVTLEKRLDEMYVSNAVKRPIYRTLDIIKDIVKATGKAPEKIFIEMARGGDPDQKGKRKDSRKQTLLDLLKKVKDEDAKILSEQIESMGDGADSKLQSEALFLYYLQLGKCMYSGEPIDVEKLGDGTYNVDHIFPQSKVKDDSILNNKVLVLSTYNKEKGDSYPVPSDWRRKMYPIWKDLKEAGLMTEEKFNRLTRQTPFTSDEEWGFINRQLVETRQSTKAIATLLKEKYPETDIVYVKAGLVSDFRHEYGLLKCRSVNDLHHAKDAYLNIVCGNLYNEHFTKKWFLKASENNEKYNLKLGKLLGEIKTATETIDLENGRKLFRNVPVKTSDGEPVFEGKVVRNGEKVVWNKEESFYSVYRTMRKNNVHQTFFAITKRHGQNGGLFDQNPLKAAPGLIPRKEGLPTELYGGYSGETTSFGVFVRIKKGNKSNIKFVGVHLKDVDFFSSDMNNAVKYVKRELEAGSEDVEILLGGRKIKIGTMFDFDGLRMILAAHSKKDGRIGFKVITPLILSNHWEKYIKAIESFVAKISKKGSNAQYRYDEKYDVVNKKQNVELYDILVDKLNNSPYCNRPTCQADQFESERTAFEKLSVENQSQDLISFLSFFNRTSLNVNNLNIKNYCRLRDNLLVWEKDYNNVKIIDSSPSGLYEKQSDNLLDLL